MIKEYKEAMHKLNKLDKENNQYIKTFTGQAKEIALQTKRVIREHKELFNKLNTQHDNL